ncbi:sigma 54-interacting transcriptional regulator [bacterium]|nr:sigma 54-interacting transcriptional regulator [bacterium]
MKSFDENTFFREATLRICGNLEIDKALKDSLLYIRDYIPADFMGFVIYLPDEKQYETIAVASLDSSDTLAVKSPISKKDEKLFSLNFEGPRVTIRNWDGSKQHFPDFADTFVWPMGSHIIIEMVLSGKRMGALVIISERVNAYSQEHARRLTLLNEPLGIALTNGIRYKREQELRNRLADDKRYLENELQNFTEYKVIGGDLGLKQTMESVRKVAPANSPVLLLGETGVGKEVIANSIHYYSSRREFPFVKVNCGAIPMSLIDSELFGHEKGAFTGAVARKRGRFERADKGTIFLDEIGELPLNAQVRLLRVLQDGEIERVGGENSVTVDCRIIAATHRDLGKMIEEGEFREDLYFRLALFPLTIPPLRERKVDIPPLVRYFMHKKSRELALPGRPSLVPTAIDRLVAYKWPGNVRELENAVERALIVHGCDPLKFEEFQAQAISEMPDEVLPMANEFQKLNEVLSHHITQALLQSRGKIEGKNGAAELLGLNPGTLRQKMRKLGIPFGKNTKALY